MTEVQRSRQETSQAYDLVPGLQAQITELNRQVLELLVRRAQAPVGTYPVQPFDGLAPLLRALDEPARLALARCPIVLLDAGFGQEQLWDGAVHESASARGVGWLTPVAEVGLLRAAATLGWHLARANPYAACLSLGMTTDCARRLAQMGLRDLEERVQRRAASCRLRWEDKPSIWRQLLEAAVAGAGSQLDALLLRGVQLLAAEYRR